MTQYASQLSDFPDLLRAVAASRNIPAAIVEKDYYLTRALRALQSELGEQFILKGGTSLAKGWDLLARFSEDIDLLFKVEGGDGPISKAERDRRMKRAREVVSNTPGFTLAESQPPAEKGVHRTAVFEYPQAVEALAALSATIILEMGTRGRPTPSVSRRIQSFVADYAAAHNQTGLAADLSPFEIDLLDFRRTFVEKLFTVHAAYLHDRARNKTRHYYDLYRLCGLVEVRGFVQSAEYRAIFADVKAHSRQDFPDTPVPDNNSFATSPAFAPTGHELALLEGNYEREMHLFFVKPPSLSEILRTIAELLPML